MSCFLARLLSGDNNSISLKRKYTQQYSCNFNLFYYPFDTQVRIMIWINLVFVLNNYYTNIFLRISNLIIRVNFIVIDLVVLQSIYKHYKLQLMCGVIMLIVSLLNNKLHVPIFHAQYLIVPTCDKNWFMRVCYFIKAGNIFLRIPLRPLKLESHSCT